MEPVQARFRQSGADLGSQLRRVDVEKDMEADREDGKPTLRAGTPESRSGPRSDRIPVPDFLSLSAQLTSPHVTMEKQQHPEPPFGRECARSQAPRADGVQYDVSTWDSYVISVSNEVIRRRNRRLS